jgi:CHAT domain-containing protein
LFQAQNMDRGRVLAELIKNDHVKKTISLRDFQGQLKPDEAAIIYTTMQQGSIVINLVTQTSTFGLQNTRIDLFLDLKKRYLDRFNGNGKKPGYKPVTLEEANRTEEQLASQITQNDIDDMMAITRELMPKSYEPMLSVRRDFLKAYYEFLIAPVKTRLTGIKKLILMPDGILNFLPFEALVSAQGKYLVEEFDVRYAQSAQVKSLIEARVYEQRPKALLAMGGAIYEQMRESSATITGPDQFILLRNRASENSLANRSQREIYAAIGFQKLNYLPGTLEEVKAIQPFFRGNADVFTGNQMTENAIKAMSASVRLKNYKIIHLATHGFALPEIPELSGIAMCILQNPQSGEDGFLTAPEIAKLEMQADLAVLSACDTGLGKIYGGEGVSGLTQSLLVGGANRAIVSLWPVSDLGTMRFMTGMYDLTENHGKTYDEAVNIMKRKFIAGEFGEEFKSPDIWAPFVHYGK